MYIYIYNNPVNSRGISWGPRFLAQNLKLVPKHHQTITKNLKNGSACIALRCIESLKTSNWDKTKILPNQGPNQKNCLKTSTIMIYKQSFFLNNIFLFFWQILVFIFEVFRGPCSCNMRYLALKNSLLLGCRHPRFLGEIGRGIH